VDECKSLMAGYDVMTIDTVLDRRACRDTLKFEAGVRGVQPGSLQARLFFVWPSLVAHHVPVTRLSSWPGCAKCRV
jgi:hypothetical protein